MRSPLLLMVAVLLAAASLLPTYSAGAQDIPPEAPAPAIPPIPWQLTAFPGVDAAISCQTRPSTSVPTATGSPGSGVARMAPWMSR